MGHTTHRDLKLAVDLLGALSAQAGVAALARAGVEQLPDLVASELTTLSVCILNTGRRRVVCNPVGALSPADIACFDRFFYEHPLVRYHAGNPDGRSHRISDSLSDRSFQRTPLFNDYYRRVGIDHVIAVPMLVDSSLLVSFVLNRKGRDFSERDREVLDLVRRPLAALYRNAMALDSIHKALANAAAEEIEDGWMLLSLDAARRVTAIAPRLEPWFESVFGTRATGIGTALPGELDRAVAAQFQSIDEGLGISAQPLEISAGNGRCVVRALWRGDGMRDALVLVRRVASSPLASAAPSPAPLAPSAAMSPPASSPASLRAPSPAKAAHAALTPREREVLQWVAAGKTNAQIAEILAASPRTIGKHLENIYEKLGVETRTAAVNRAGGMPSA